MPFNSINYFIFFFTAVLIFWHLNHRYRVGFLLVASYFYYSFSSLGNLLFLIGLTGLFYGGALAVDKMEESKKRSAVFYLAAGSVIAYLVLVKGRHLFYPQVHYSLLQFSTPDMDVLLPLGVSFYSFRGLSYLTDVFKRRIPAEPHPLTFALYIAFFPPLLCGPIETATRLLPQLTAHNTFDRERLYSGLRLILVGLFKKLVLSSGLYVFASLVFSDLNQNYGFPFFLAVLYARYLIFVDLYAYSDIAVGSARVLGIDLTPNFNRPFFARSPTDFWRRFHRTLVFWFSTYVFLPLSRRSPTPNGIRASLIITFLLVGLWHVGDVWHMVWAVCHGMLYLLDNYFKNPLDRLYRRVSQHSKNTAEVVTIVVNQIFLSIPFAVAEIGRTWSMTNAQSFFRMTVQDFWNPNAFRSIFASAQPALHFFAIILMVFGVEFMHFIQTKMPVDAWFMQRSPLFRLISYVGMVASIVWFGNIYHQMFVYFRY